MKKGFKFMVAALVVLGLTGCGTVYEDTGNQIGTNSIRSDQPLRVSINAARSVERLQEIVSAHVIIKNHNAYVAVSMDSGNNMRAQGYRTSNEDKRSHNTGLLGNPGYRGYGNGTRTGEYGGTGIGGGNADGFGAGDGNGSAMSFGIGNSTGRENANSLNTKPAEIITDQSSGTVSGALPKKIARQVRKAESTIEKVYISFDPDFYMRMNRFADDINNGQSRIDGDFSSTVNKVFGKQ